VIELPENTLGSFSIVFQQPYGEFFEIGKIERALRGFAASVKRIKARDRLEQCDALSCIILIGQDRSGCGDVLFELLDQIVGPVVPSDLVEVALEVRKNFKIRSRDWLTVPLAKACAPFSHESDLLPLAHGPIVENTG